MTFQSLSGITFYHVIYPMWLPNGLFHITYLDGQVGVCVGLALICPWTRHTPLEVLQ
jgi:hypothetical protein